ncbi:MAG: hypothetical protein L0Y38_01465 [Methylococcaceae bacterium]|nr:hypothetical protein [Methylococcaceae bacterium]MCI0666460.1 hypothetical protein [Methylococcaceae bacterium]MCI0732473.1 hypothetical protein [Methylococcaceae bacterium]
MPYFTELFKSRYRDSLDFFRSFYDDIAEYGNPVKARHAFYFVPGFNGAPGQIRFALNSLVLAFGPEIYLRCLDSEDFSAKKPVWGKYTPQSMERKRAAFVKDIIELGERFEHLTVIVSSSGFYDFLAGFTQLPDSIKPRIKLAWIACAPDRSEPSKWEPLFYALNGFTLNGHRWFAYPNHNWLSFINPECNANIKWAYGPQRKTFFKNDLESRFYVWGLLWDYLSFDLYNWVTGNNIGQSRFPIDIECAVMVATEDGYWLGKEKSEIESVVYRYLSNATILYRKTTHLWVTVPENISALIHALHPEIATDASERPPFVEFGTEGSV